MRVGYAALLLLLLIVACARVKPETPVSEPKSVPTQPGAPPSAVKPVAPAKPQRGAAAPAAPIERAAGPKAAGNAAPPLAKTPTTAATLDLKALEAQLKDTKAIGFFTKISLKNQVDDLLGRFRQHYKGTAKVTLTDLRRSYDLLMMKVLSLLQDEDQMLASAIVSSREAIWRLLADPKTFATLTG